MPIYKNPSDYKFFLYLLKKYLNPTFKEKRTINGEIVYLPVNTVSGLVHLNAFCLMPNHFHLLVYNIKDKGLTKLMLRVLTAYSNYFNKKYDRQGALFQGSFRSVIISSERQLTVTGVYIHLNPYKLANIKDFTKYSYSSFTNYLENSGTNWLVVDPTLQKLVDFKSLPTFANKLKADYEELNSMGLGHLG